MIIAGGSDFVKATTADRPHKFATIANLHLSAVVVDTRSVTIQRPNNWDEKISRIYFLIAFILQKGDNHVT